MTLLCVDVGSTFTKAALVDAHDGALVGRATTATTAGTDVLHGIQAARADLAAQGLDVPALRDRDRVLVCSSAGGGLRLAVVGYERVVTAEAGRRAGLSAGATVVHVTAGAISAGDVHDVRAARPDVLLLVGGTDGGNAEVLLHNARRIAAARLSVPVVVAGNREARGAAAQALARTGRRFVLADNVLPRLGVIDPASARAAIREVFLSHVIGGKQLSRGPQFAAMVRAATPDAVLTGAETLGAAVASDVMVLDVGGATTDVYSVLTPEGEDASLRKDVVATLWHARTVEGDLGMRWSAPGVLRAADTERLELGGAPALTAWVEAVHADPRRVPVSVQERGLDLQLARLAAVTAARRHGRAGQPGEQPRPLTNVTHLVGSGGVLRHAPAEDAALVLAAVLADRAGGWRPPATAATIVDTAYLLFVAGLLAPDRTDLARAVAAQVVATD